MLNSLSTKLGEPQYPFHGRGPCSRFVAKSRLQPSTERQAVNSFLLFFAQSIGFPWQAVKRRFRQWTKPCKAHRDGIIAGTGATGGRISRWNITRPGDCLQAGFLFRQDRTDALFGQDSGKRICRALPACGPRPGRPRVSGPLRLPRGHQQQPQLETGRWQGDISLPCHRRRQTQNLYPACRGVHPPLPPTRPTQGFRQSSLLSLALPAWSPKNVLL